MARKRIQRKTTEEKIIDNLMKLNGYGRSKAYRDYHFTIGLKQRIEL